MIFTRQLATLIDSGLPLLRSLNVLAKQERDKLMKRTIDKLADSVQSGSTFSDALALHPKIFNDLYVNMVKAGEVGGVLELVLTRQQGVCAPSRAPDASGVGGANRRRPNPTLHGVVFEVLCFEPAVAPPTDI